MDDAFHWSIETHCTRPWGPPIHAWGGIFHGSLHILADHVTRLEEESPWVGEKAMCGVEKHWKKGQRTIDKNEVYNAGLYMLHAIP